MQMRRRRGWIFVAILVATLIMSGFALSALTDAQASPDGAASMDCRVALVISRQEAEAAGVDWAVAKRQQHQWSGTYRCGDEAAKSATLQSASEAKQRFLSGR